MKNSKVIRFLNLVICVTTLLVVIFSLIGCSAKSEEKAAEENPQIEEVKVEEVQPEEKKPTIPPTYFSDNNNKIVDIEGNEIDCELNKIKTSSSTEGDQKEEVEFLTTLAEDRILLERKTSKYDAKWNAEYDQKTQLVLVDSMGETVAELDNITSKYGSQNFEATASSHFSDGRLVVEVKYISDENNKGGLVDFVIDTNGTEVFSIGEGENTTYRFHIRETARTSLTNEIIYGRILISNVAIFDLDGKLIKQENTTDGEMDGLVGSNFYYDTRYYDNKGSSCYYEIYNIDGAKFDPRTLSTEQISFDKVERIIGSNVVKIQGSAKNPYGGIDVTAEGLYNLALGKWVIHPKNAQKFPIHYSGSSTNQIYVDFSGSIMKEQLFNEEITPDADDNSSSMYRCIIDSSGNLIFDLSMSGIEPYCNQPSSSFSAKHVIGGYWLIKILAPHASNVHYLIYFDENNKYIGAVPTKLSGGTLDGYGLLFED